VSRSLAVELELEHLDLLAGELLAVVLLLLALAGRLMIALLVQLDVEADPVLEVVCLRAATVRGVQGVGGQGHRVAPEGRAPTLMAVDGLGGGGHSIDLMEVE
jgi:hypothetical protein